MALLSNANALKQLDSCKSWMLWLKRRLCSRYPRPLVTPLHNAPLERCLTVNISGTMGARTRRSQ